MKYLFLAFLLVGCMSDNKNVTPKFRKGETVNYKVPNFYSLVCSGKNGKIDSIYTCWEGCEYTITTSNEEPQCPATLKVNEEDLILDRN